MMTKKEPLPPGTYTVRLTNETAKNYYFTVVEGPYKDKTLKEKKPKVLQETEH